MTKINEGSLIYTAIEDNIRQYMPPYLYIKAYVFLFELQRLASQQDNSEEDNFKVPVSEIIRTHRDLSEGELDEILEQIHFCLSRASANIRRKRRTSTKKEQIGFIPEDLNKLYRSLIRSGSNIIVNSSFPYKSFFKVLRPKTGPYKAVTIERNNYDLALGQKCIYFIDQPEDRLTLLDEQIELVKLLTDGVSLSKKKIVEKLESIDVNLKDPEEAIKQRIRTLNTKFEKWSQGEKLIDSAQGRGYFINNLYSISYIKDGH